MKFRSQLRDGSVAPLRASSATVPAGQKLERITDVVRWKVDLGGRAEVAALSPVYRAYLSVSPHNSLSAPTPFAGAADVGGDDELLHRGEGMAEP